MAFSKLDGKGIDLSSNVLTSFASTGIDDNATSTAITIDADENTTFAGKINATVDSNIAAAFSSTTTTAKITLADANDTAFIDVNATRLGIGHSSSTSLQALQIEPTSAEAMRIDSDGNVGIGNINPDARLSVATDQQLIARLASSNTGITGVRLEGIDASASDNVYVDWFYDAENRQYGFGEGTASGSLPINSGIAQADIIVNDSNVRVTSGNGLSSLSVTNNPLTLGSLTSFNLAFDPNEIQARDNGAANSLIINKYGGFVSIGWNNPQAPLDIYQVTGDDFRISASSTDYWGINAGSHFNINDSGTIRFKIYDTGKILIGDDASPETLVHIRDSSTAAYAATSTGVDSYTPRGGDLLQVQNYSTGVDNVYAGIWFETGNPATNTTGSNRSGRIALVVDNDAAYGADFVWQLRTTDAALKENLRLTHEGTLKFRNRSQIGGGGSTSTFVLGPSTNGTDSDGALSLYGSPTYDSGAGLILYGEDHAVNANIIKFVNGSFVERFRINENGTQKATFTDTVLKEATNYVHYDINIGTSDTQWSGADYTKSGIFLDMDASGSGGNTTDELRLYGIRADLRSTHQTADLLTGVYGYVESQHDTGTTTNLYGVYGYAVADETGTGRTSNCIGVQGLSYGYGSGTGGYTNHYGGYFKTLLSTANDKDTLNVYGTRTEIEIDNPGQAQTVTTAYVVASEFDNDSAGNVTIDYSYLYYGNYAGTLPTNAFGLYIFDSVQNYLGGSFSVGGTKNFRIKHPLPALAETHDLVHTAIEAPSADNIYSGMINLVDGSATVNIDTIAGMTEGTFVALNRSVRRFVSNEEGFTAVKSSIAGNILTITAQDNTCTDEVFWMVIGQRQDAEIKATPGTDADGYLIVEPEHVEHVRPEKGEVYDERDIGPDTVEE